MTSLRKSAMRLSPADFIFHFQRGRYYGFPTCCNLWYCTFSWLPDWMYNPPVNFWKRLGVPDDRGYIPCPLHYKQGPSFQ